MLVFLLFCIYAITARWYYVCQVKQLCTDSERLHTLALREGETVILQGYDQFVFDTGQVSPRLNDNNRIFLDSVAAFLQAHPDKKLTITGFFRPSEEGREYGYYENLGTARAAVVRQALEQRGIAEDRMSLDYGLSPSEELLEPLRFEIYADGASDYERIAFTFTNMTFSDAHFAFDSDVFRPGQSFLLYADSVKAYLAVHPEKKLLITGHTDWIGTREYNYDLGMRRAGNAAWYFRKIGVTATIETQSMGERRPVASNKTKAGRQKNRRVNFQIIDGDGT